MFYGNWQKGKNIVQKMLAGDGEGGRDILREEQKGGSATRFSAHLRRGVLLYENSTLHATITRVQESCHAVRTLNGHVRRPHVHGHLYVLRVHTRVFSCIVAVCLGSGGPRTQP